MIIQEIIKNNNCCNIIKECIILFVVLLVVIFNSCMPKKNYNNLYGRWYKNHNSAYKELWIDTNNISLIDSEVGDTSNYIYKLTNDSLYIYAYLKDGGYLLYDVFFIKKVNEKDLILKKNNIKVHYKRKW